MVTIAETDLEILVGNLGGAAPSGESAKLIRENLEKAFSGDPVLIKVDVDPKSLENIKSALANLKIDVSANIRSSGVSKDSAGIPYTDFQGAVVSTRHMSQATAELTKTKIDNIKAINDENLAHLQATHILQQNILQGKADVEVSKQQLQQSKLQTEQLKQEAAQRKLNAQATKEQISAAEKLANKAVASDKVRSDAKLGASRLDDYLASVSPKGLTALSSEIAGVHAKFDVALGSGLRKDLVAANAAVNNLKASMKSLGYEGGNIFTYMEAKVKTFATYLVSSTLTMGVVNGIKQIIANVEDLDAALTDLRIVTGGTRAETQELLKVYNQMAQELGTTTTEVASGASNWLRQGYSAAESAELLKQSMTLSVIAQMESAEATEALSAAMLGYQLRVEDMSGVVDKFFKVDMAAATSSDKLAIALSKTAANAKLAGLSLDDVIGQLAVVNSTMQEAGESTGGIMRLAA